MHWRRDKLYRQPARVAGEVIWPTARGLNDSARFTAFRESLTANLAPGGDGGVNPPLQNGIGDQKRRDTKALAGMI
jgi:hypothetical protein